MIQDGTRTVPNPNYLEDSFACLLPMGRGDKEPFSSFYRVKSKQPVSPEIWQDNETPPTQHLEASTFWPRNAKETNGKRKDQVRLLVNGSNEV